MYKFAISNANLVTYVSPIMGQKIQEILKHKRTNRLFYLPNSPQFNQIPKLDIDKKDKRMVVYTKSFLSSTEIDLLIKTMKRVNLRKKDVIMHIIGCINQKDIEKIKSSNVKNNFILHGLIPYKKNIQILSKAYIGIAWYENKISFEKYADSLKLREYAASGIPAICNGNISTAYEMQKEKAGIMVNDINNLADSIILLLENSKTYLKMRENSLKWAQANDKLIILEKLFFKMIQND